MNPNNLNYSPVIYSVHPTDARRIVADVEFPAMQDGPMYRLMFPPSSALRDDQRDEIIQWYIDGLEEALHDNNTFYQIQDYNGTPVGFCGWALHPTGLSQAQSNQGGATKPKRSNCPNTLDVAEWLRVSALLRIERTKALTGLSAFGRLTFMSVHPHYQRKGGGSLLLSQFCQEMDQAQLPAAVMASPAGVSLYKMLSFEPVGSVDTGKGEITCMMRQPQLRARA